MMWLLALACRAPGEPSEPGAEPPAPRPDPVPTTPTEPTGATDTDPPGPPTLEIDGSGATTLGVTAFSANGRVHPHGEPTEYWFEYGLDTTYGSSTARRALGPRLAAHYAVSWDDGLEGWVDGAWTGLVHHPTGGASGGHVRYHEPSVTDYNHTDGIGLLHLCQYMYPGIFEYYPPTAALGGADPDFTDARVAVQVRGVDWEERIWYADPSGRAPFARGDELVFWAQADATAADDFSHMSNWAHTGSYLTDGLFSGAWTAMEYRLHADTRDWSYAGQDRTQGRDVYVYHPLGEVLRHLDVDFFHLLLFIDTSIELRGAIDFDEFELTYRNHSVLLDSNGGSLTSAPASASDPARLVDGWRNGPDHTWVSDADPTGPLVFTYELADPVVIDRVQIHNDPDWPSREVEVHTSIDGATWTLLASGTLPEVDGHGPNFAFELWTGLAVEARHVRVTVRSGWRPEAWGLGEIEVFGTGAVKLPDDDWYTVTDDVTGLVPGETYHWRLVAQRGAEVVAGPDQVYVVPDGTVPEVETGVATVIDAGHVRLAGVIDTLGGAGTYTFELGTDTSYGRSSVPSYTGPEITPRTFSRVLELDHPDLADLAPGTVVHWRLSYCAGCSTPDPADDVIHPGADATFVVP